MFGTGGGSSKYKKRERTQNWCIDEKKYLLELCRKDMYIIENKRLDSALTSLKNRAWKIIHKKFCHTFGTDRNCNRIKEQWRRMKGSNIFSYIKLKSIFDERNFSSMCSC